MRVLLRVGIITGAGAAVVLYALASSVALAAAIGILLTGLLAGMGVAKWLEWGWYGRQLEAGWQAGALASGLAGLGTLGALVVDGPRSTAALAAQSHLFGLDLGALVGVLSGLGWVGTDLVVVLVSAALGTGVAAAASLLFAFGKSARAVEAITHARHAAQAANRSEPLNTPLPLPGYPTLGAPPTGPGWYTSPPSGAIPPGLYAAPTLPPPGRPAPNSGRGPSTARPVERELDDDEREALARWAEEHPGDASGPRTPAPSTYLNSPTPAPKRNRKKQQTRDWLC